MILSQSRLNPTAYQAVLLLQRTQDLMLECPAVARQLWQHSQERPGRRAQLIRRDGHGSRSGAYAHSARGRGVALAAGGHSRETLAERARQGARRPRASAGRPPLAWAPSRPFVGTAGSPKRREEVLTS